MAVDDLWYLTKRGPDGERLPSKRYGRGKRWRVRYTDDGGLPKQLLFEKKVDADRFDAQTRADVSRGVYVDPAAGKVTVKAYAQEWRSVRLHRDSTAERVDRAFRLHVEPTVLGGMQMARVKPSHVQSWVKDRATVLAPMTLRVLYGSVSSMFAAAAIDRVIGVSPCQNIRLPDLEQVEYFIPTAEQVHALAAALCEQRDQLGRQRAIPNDRYRATVFMAAGCGLRQGETLGLELDHVDFLRREVSVVQQLVMSSTRPPYLAPPKTRTSRRTVELGQVVAEELARHIERFPPVEVEIDDETDPRKPVRRTAKLLFTNRFGNPVRRNQWWTIWVPAVTVAGLPKGFGFHGLRHYYATVLIFGGANVKTVQLALGHSKPSITLDTYVGLWPDAVDRTRNLVDAALGPRRNTSGLAVAR